MKRIGIEKSVANYLSMRYTITLKRDDEGDVVGRVQEFEGCTAHGENESVALANLREMQSAWIAARLEAGLEIPVPETEEDLPSGKFLQRVSRSLHQRLIRLARKEKVSLNTLVTTILAEATASKITQNNFEAAILQQLALSPAKIINATSIAHSVWQDGDLQTLWSIDVGPPVTFLGNSCERIIPKVTPTKESWVHHVNEKKEYCFAN